MTIIVFLLDTSASMNQRVFLGGRPSLLDVAKSAVETFVKVRQRSVDSRGDRYMLLTFEETPNNIKAGWKENLQTFMSELKNLQATGLTTLSQALRQTFDVLNINRMQHGIDTYGQGRCPFYLEPSIIVVITDGGQLSSNSGVTDEVKWSGSSPGSELTREPFRWDQRLFSLVLRMSGQPSSERETGLVPTDPSPIDSWCEVTGGRSYSITTHRMLHQCIDSLVQKVQAGVVIHFEKYGADPPPTEGSKPDDDEEKWQSCRKMIYVSRSNQKTGFAGGFWPIPESFWPEPGLPSLPARTAHPNTKFTCVPHEPLAIDNFPFDKYELEPSPLTQFILARKQSNICWQVFLPTSSKMSSLGSPFGYLKASTSLTCVNLFVMPYNYPVLLPLLDDLLRVHRLKPTNEWRSQFAMYMSTMPPYYAGPLKRALLRIGAGSIAQNVLEDNYLSFSVLSYLKKLKSQAKAEYERTCSEVGLRVGKEVKRVIGFRNPFDVPREQLLEHLSKLRTRFFRPTSIINSETNSQPVAQMGNYQEYLKRMPTPLREIESTPVRQHMFGNPFKIDKRMVIDEAEIDISGRAEPGATTPTRTQKRKPGPLPKDYVFIPRKNRALTPTPYQPSIMQMEEDVQPSVEMETVAENTVAMQNRMPLVDIDMDDEFVSPYVGIFGEDIKLNPTTSVEKMVENLPLPTPPPPVILPLETPAPTVVPTPSSVSVIMLAPPAQTQTESQVPVAVTVAETKPEPSPVKEEKIKVIVEKVNDENVKVNVENSKVIVEKSKVIVEKAKVIVEKAKLNVEKAKEVNVNVEKVKDETYELFIDESSQSNEVVPPVEDEEKVHRTNLNIRVELHKEIRKPRIRMDVLLTHLKSLAGSQETKLKFVKGLEREALRFRRKKLADIFQEQRESMMRSSVQLQS